MRQHPREACIIDACRTPIGRGNPDTGVLRDIHAADLLGRTFVGLLNRTGIDCAEIDNVVIGCAFQMAEQGNNIARTAWLAKGLPQEAGAVTLDVRCGSGQQAVNYGASMIQASVNDLLVVGGVEHMGRVGFAVSAATQASYGTPFPPELLQHHSIGSQGMGAELIADQWGLTRDEMDRFSHRSHVRAALATANGGFAREILPVETPGGIVSVDQGIRNDSTIESLNKLKPAFRENGRITAGSASQISDGAAALLLAGGDAAARLGLRPRARIVDQVMLGVDPVSMLTGPIPATRRLLERNGLTVDDIDSFEINEAFAAVVLAWQRELGADDARLNPRGGAIALGHPLGCSGARLMTTLLHHLEDTDGELGVVAMCCGGGIGTATLVQRI